VLRQMRPAPRYVWANRLKGNTMLSTLLIAALILLLMGALPVSTAARVYALSATLIMSLLLSRVDGAAAAQHSAVTDPAKAIYSVSRQDDSPGRSAEQRPSAPERWQVAMDWDRVQGNWKQFEGKIREQWGLLTNNDLEKAAGKRERLEGLIQERYGIAKDVARKQVDEWLSQQRWPE